MNRPAALLLSVALHATPLLVLVQCAPSGNGPAQGGEPLPDKLRGADEKPLEVRIIREDGESEAAANAAAEASCPGESYTGIGIFHDMSYRVFYVGANTPAARAGLRDDDIIENHEVLGRDRYPVGHVHWLRILRGDQRLMVRVTVGTVCN